MGSLSLLQQIFPTQESNWSLLHCRQSLYQLNNQGSSVNTDSSRMTLGGKSGGWTLSNREDRWLQSQVGSAFTTHLDSYPVPQVLLAPWLGSYLLLPQ